MDADANCADGRGEWRGVPSAAHQEHWAFARTAKQRAADFVKAFSAFTNGRDNGNLQAFVLRPKLRKASLGELKHFVNDIGKKYGRVIDKARAKGIARPVAMFIHIRWDIESKLWDVHLHAVVDVPPENLETLFLRLIGKLQRRSTLRI